MTGATHGEVIPYDDSDWPKGKWKVSVAKFEGPYKEWFDAAGNFHRLYASGAESVITRELLEDDIQHSEGI